ncbi:Flagellar basal body rod protein FlgB [Beijerinckiaceae bacterium RH AL1]|jgi:flagellar basal-body rod protein FlgB|nr:flagellar basal body rod protein FlgB [Beijerinckiaceae bacterium]VVB47911.1 Flagellar basal body rod protein FlgB [Beijerinckiaceae bacterium RH CH11]VVB47988.1 Flagellar basal body rod protein FlgB [Beijerinckiaceae bacterium RH AL8]VVC56127.1 Flagellar basal body rod protein FlgB [Beijerinckiaceae bacterium RH AL1]
MEPIYLLGLASRKSAWLSVRQSAVAENVANMNTPGYQQKDVKPFADVLAQTHLQMASTDAGHLPVTDTAGVDGTTSDDDGGFEVTESGNTVGIETQMGKAGEIQRDYALTTNIVRSFHNMLMASLKS